MARLLSSNLKIDCGSCSRTFVSSTKVLTFAETLIREVGAVPRAGFPSVWISCEEL